MIADFVWVLFQLYKLLLGMTAFVSIVFVYTRRGLSVAYKVIIQDEQFVVAVEEMEEEFEEEMVELEEVHTIRYNRLVGKFPKLH